MNVLPDQTESLYLSRHILWPTFFTNWAGWNWKSTKFIPHHQNSKILRGDHKFTTTFWTQHQICHCSKTEIGTSNLPWPNIENQENQCVHSNVDDLFSNMITSEQADVSPFVSSLRCNSVIVALRNCLVINHTPVTKIKNKTKKFMKLERQETLPVTMTMTLTFSVWKSVDWGPVPNRRSIKPSGIINTFFPLSVQNRVPGILFLGWTPFWLAADQEYPQVVYFWSQPQLHQDTFTLHADTVCNKTD